MTVKELIEELHKEQYPGDAVVYFAFDQGDLEVRSVRVEHHGPEGHPDRATYVILDE